MITGIRVKSHRALESIIALAFYIFEFLRRFYLRVELTLIWLTVLFSSPARATMNLSGDHVYLVP